MSCDYGKWQGSQDTTCCYGTDPKQNTPCGKCTKKGCKCYEGYKADNYNPHSSQLPPVCIQQITPSPVPSTHDGCHIIGNPQDDPYCKDNAYINKYCNTGCATYVPGIGHTCCSHKCCKHYPEPPIPVPKTHSVSPSKTLVPISPGHKSTNSNVIVPIVIVVIVAMFFIIFSNRRRSYRN